MRFTNQQIQLQVYNFPEMITNNRTACALDPMRNLYLFIYIQLEISVFLKGICSGYWPVIVGLATVLSFVLEMGFCILYFFIYSIDLFKRYCTSSLLINILCVKVETFNKHIFIYVYKYKK